MILGSILAIFLALRRITFFVWYLFSIEVCPMSSCAISLGWRLKACVCYFLPNFYFSPNDSPKLWKMFFISSKKLFSFKIFKICMFIFPPFLPASHCFRGWFKKNLKVYDVINCPNKNLITHYVWYLEKEIRCDIKTLSIEY